MNKNTLIGLALMIAAGILTCVCASANGGLAAGLFGKALWYLPYLAMVGSIRALKSR